MKRKACGVVALAVLMTAGLMGQTRPASPGTTATGPGGELRMAGQTEPVAKVEVPAGMKGILKSVDVKQGQVVKKGDQLAKLDDALQAKQVELADIQAASNLKIKMADATLESARSEYEKIKVNSSASPAEKVAKELAVKQGEIQLEWEKEEKKILQVKLDQEKITLDRMTIRSPIDGAVLRVNKQAGEQTDENPLVVVVNVSKLSAVFYPGKQLFGKVKVGDKAVLEFATDPVTKREAVVTAVDPTIEQSIFQVKFEVENGDAKVPAGTAVTWVWEAK